MDKAERQVWRIKAQRQIENGGMRADRRPAGKILLLGTELIDLLDHIDALEQKREGWKLVPCELPSASRDILMEYCRKMHANEGSYLFTTIWRELIAAAPEPQ